MCRLQYLDTHWYKDVAYKDKTSNSGTSNFDYRWTWNHKVSTPVLAQKILTWLLNVSKISLIEWNVSLSDGMGFLVKYRAALIVQIFFQTYIYGFWREIHTIHCINLCYKTTGLCCNFLSKYPPESTYYFVLIFLLF